MWPRGRNPVPVPANSNWKIMIIGESFLTLTWRPTTRVRTKEGENWRRNSLRKLVAANLHSVL